jgi:hypothetical protein
MKKNASWTATAFLLTGHFRKTARENETKIRLSMLMFRKDEIGRVRPLG